MKQAILITAYKNIAQLTALADFFDSDFNLYIHYDRKYQVPEKLLKELTSKGNVRFFTQKYKVNWGGRNHLLAILHLIKQSLENEENIYFHLITGQDYPIKSVVEFNEFFSSNINRNYLEHFPMPAKCWKNGGMDRIEYYNFYDLIDAKKNWLMIMRLKNLQQRLGFKRSIMKDLPSLYGGSTYWSMNRSTVAFVNTYTRLYPELLKRMRHTFCAEEIYIPTVVMNSQYAKNTDKDNLRFIVWEERHGSIPALLDETDLVSITQSGAYFARKFEPGISDTLQQKLAQGICDPAIK